jgi:CheY-like chemotaxis protein
VLSRLFTPFFTTKPVGVGTGLGLSICQRIVTGFGGAITVTSEVGRGTTFRVTLPAAVGEPAERDAAALAVPPARRRGRILVIDDEPMVAKALSRTLGLDHTVITVSRATEALARIAAEPPFDVVLCDIMMPHMTGVELYEELRRRDPAIAERVIFLTGGAFTATARAFLDSVPNQRVEKPFDPHHLRALINDRLR